MRLVSPGSSLIIVSLALLLSTCGERAAQEGKKGGKKDGPVPVAIAKVFTRDVPTDLQIIGNVEAYSIVAVKSRVTGPIDKVWFKEGDYVRKGDKLFTIDPAPFQTAVAQAEVADAADPVGRHVLLDPALGDEAALVRLLPWEGASAGQYSGPPKGVKRWGRAAGRYGAC